MLGDCGKGSYVASGWLPARSVPTVPRVSVLATDSSRPNAQRQGVHDSVCECRKAESILNASLLFPGRALLFERSRKFWPRRLWGISRFDFLASSLPDEDTKTSRLL